VHQNIEAQIQQQATEIGRLSQQVTSLNSLLAQLNTSSGNPASGATAADIAKLNAQIAKVKICFQYTMYYIVQHVKY